MGCADKYLHGICSITIVERSLLIGHIVSFLIILFIKIRELVALNAPLSKATKRLVDIQKIKKAKIYYETKTYFSIAEQCLKLLITLFLIRYRLLSIIYNSYFSKIHNSNMYFFLSCIIAKGLIDLPFVIISGLYIETAHKTLTFLVFNFFKSKFMYGWGYLSNWILFESISILFPENYYICFWFLFFYRQMCYAFMTAEYIWPLFNKCKQLNESDLKIKINEVAETQGYRTDRILEMQKSNSTNAYTIGFGSETRIFLCNRLFKLLNNDEIVAVVSHELGHWKNNHYFWTHIFWSVSWFIYAYLFKMFSISPYLKKELFYDCDSLCVKSFYFYFIFQIFEALDTIVNNLISRAHEREADKFAVSLGFGEQLKSSLIKMHKKRSYHIEHDIIYSILNYDHPVLIERLEFIEKEIEKFKAKGWKELGLEKIVINN